jgi:putative PIN family toxin of toxin-antitoxin system
VRVVIDTNIWVSGLLWRGMPWKLLCLAEAGQVELCVAPSMLVELGEVLAYGRCDSTSFTP